MSLWTDESVALIDDNRPGSAGALLFRNPRGTIEAHESSEVDAALRQLDAARAEGLHAVGFFSYELGYALESRLAPLMPERRNVPLLSFGLFAPPERIAQPDVERTLYRIRPENFYTITHLTARWDEAAYRTRFDAVRDFIAAGDAYQINLTFPLDFVFEGDPATLFAELRRSARAGYGACFLLNGLSVLSLSPELLLRKQGAALTTRPMKGTAPRGPTLETDAIIRDGLAADAKNRAENLMIVDLLRNDLGRITRTGSVHASALFEIETYPTLHQMISEITAEAMPQIDLKSMLTALFPCGSVTGAPKIRAMEIIRALEPEPRGLYCGAIGHIRPDGDLTFNVAIRTVSIDGKGMGRLGIGSGLVFDSDAGSEYAECLLKSAFLTQDHTPFELFESFRWSPPGHDPEKWEPVFGKDHAQRNRNGDGSDPTQLNQTLAGYVLLEQHLQRLARSSAYFGFAHDEAEIRRCLDAAAVSFSTPRRVRLALSETGNIAITDSAFPDSSDRPWRAILSRRAVRSGDPFLYHKTTRRAFFETERERLNAAFGADEALFVNERGEMTEGSRTNIFVERGGVLLTPAQHCGLLPGTLRAQLIAEGKAREAVLTPADLAVGDALFVGNSVRGLIRAQFIGAED
jgi:para-aminobenzoate synthetase/4-amino-4-deoxychorismate lyase